MGVPSTCFILNGGFFTVTKYKLLIKDTAPSSRSFYKVFIASPSLTIAKL